MTEKFKVWKKCFLFLKRKLETHNNGYKNSNIKFETKPSGNNDKPLRKSILGYKNSNVTLRASIFKLTISKCIFFVNAGNEHDSKLFRLNFEDKKKRFCKQGIYCLF